VNAPQPSTAQTMPRRAAFRGDLAGAGAAAVWPERQAVAVPGLGPLESAIMTVLWDAREPLTVRGVRDRLDYCMEDGGDPAYTTVMTVTTILWRKGLLSRDKLPGEADQRAWWYQPRVTREDHLARVIRGALACAPDPAAVLLRALPAPGGLQVCVAQVMPGVYVRADLPVW
jgi:predicted transcriptional regulator